MKIFIDEPVKRIDGKPETELKPTSAIRFQFDDNTRIIIKYDEESGELTLYKSFSFDDRISITLVGANKVLIK